MAHPADLLADQRRLLAPGRNCCALTRARRAAVLIDAVAYFEAFARAAERARDCILILAWDFDSRILIGRDQASPYRRTLGDFLNDLARRRKRLRICILDWDYPLIFGTEREFPPLYGLSWRPHHRIEFRYDGTSALAGSHHQKIVVIDDRLAFTGGLDLTCRRWDTPDHKPADPRRVDNGSPYPPFHDVMTAFDGAAAGAMAALARERWYRATGARLTPAAAASDPWPEPLKPTFRDIDLGIACTAPGIAGIDETRQVEHLYLDMIAAARRYIYIENQYFTANSIGEALAARLQETGGPEIVVVSRLLSHGWLEEMTMHLLRVRLVQRLRAADRERRFHIYCPHVDGLAERTCVDLHSKVMIVDDRWLRIGSANVSNRSMGLDTECDVVFDADRDAAASVRHVRDRLLGEHLGVDAERFAAAFADAGTLNAAIASLGSAHRTLRPLACDEVISETALSAAAIADPERPVSMEMLAEQFAPDLETRHRLPRWFALAAGALALVACALAWRYAPLAEAIAPERVLAFVQSFAGCTWAPLAVSSRAPGAHVSPPASRPRRR